MDKQKLLIRLLADLELLKKLNSTKEDSDLLELVETLIEELHYKSFNNK